MRIEKSDRSGLDAIRAGSRLGESWMGRGNEHSAPVLHFGQSGAKFGQRSPHRRPIVDSAGYPPSGTISLGGLVEAEIIPRLLLAHCDAPCGTNDSRRYDEGGTVTAGAPGGGFDPGEAERFATRPLELEADELLSEVEVFLARGVSVESIMVDLLAPSARRLGELWEDDECDFVDVTMGLWRLQEVMREIALGSPSLVRFFSAAPSVLFTPMPGDNHSFGALMVEEIFARSGWQSEVLFKPERQELLAIVAERSLDLVGLTLSCESPTGTVAELIAAIRAVSPNTETRVIIGGPMVNAEPDLVALVGADGTASDARSALALAQRLVTSTRFSFGCV